jgi:hypothetical protein
MQNASNHFPVLCIQPALDLHRWLLLWYVSVWISKCKLNTYRSVSSPMGVLLGTTPASSSCTLCIAALPTSYSVPLAQRKLRRLIRPL